MIRTTAIPGLLVIEGSKTFEDERGFFREPFRRDELEAVHGSTWIHVQENHTYSKKNVLRGIHVAPWNKMVYVPYGEVLCVLVDTRRDSPTFKRNLPIIIGDSNRVKLFIPIGLGNSHFTLSEEAVYEYQVDQYYVAGRERGIAWDDPELKIEWPSRQPTLSEKDQHNPSLETFLTSCS